MTDFKRDRWNLDKAIDFRKQNFPHETKPIKTNLTAADLHRCLGLPAAGKYPTSCLYRGYRIASKEHK